MYGAPSLLGVNIGGSLGMEVPVLDKVKVNQPLAGQPGGSMGEMLGIPYSIFDELTSAVDAVLVALVLTPVLCASLLKPVDFASGKFASRIGNAVRGNSAAISAAETFDLTSLPADLTGNLIAVGDKSMLVVAVEQAVSGGTVVITPILYDNESTPAIVGILPPKTFVQPYAFRRGASSGNYVLPVQVWDVSGAYKIGLHVSALTGTSNAAKAWGWVI